MVAIISGLLARNIMKGRCGDPGTRERLGKKLKLSSLTGRMRSYLFGLVVPLNASLAIFIWYLVPLILTDQNAGPALIGRIVMLYYVAMILTGPIARWLTAIGPGRNATMIMGTFIWSAAIWYVALNQEVWAITVSVVLLGVGHRLVRTPLIDSFLKMTK